MEHFIQAYKKTAKLLIALLCALCSYAGFAASVDIALFSDHADVRQEEQVTFTVVVRNYGSAEAADLLVADSLPKGMTFISCSAADLSTRGRNLLVKIPPLRSGDEFTFDITVRMERRGSVEKVLQLQKNGLAIKSASARVNVQSNNVLEIKVTMFTPNGDGVNDYFEIPGLQHYPNNELVVFNRFSDKVYQARGYNNDWDAAGLPNGNYFYVLTVYLDNGAVQKYNGYVAVKR